MSEIPPTLSVVIPLHQEASHLRASIGVIQQVLAELPVWPELILVDDGSKDATWAEIQSLAQADPRLIGLRLSRNFGKEAALAAGLERASGAAIVVMDGDLQHPPALLPQMLTHWLAGAEVVEAVKLDRGAESLGSRWRARLFYKLFSRLSGHALDGASDFKLMDRRVLEAWRRLGERNLFFRGMHAWLGFRRVQLPFDVAPRAGGAGQWTSLQLIRLAVNAVTAFSSAPLQLVSVIGGAFLAFSLALGAQTLYLKLSGHAVDGFTTVILLLLVIGGAVMTGLGIIGSYIARIYDEVKQRPRYIVAEQVGAP